MNDINDINSILNAVNEINLRSKKKKIDISIPLNPMPKLNEDFKISPDIDKLIQEAETYKKNFSSVPHLIDTKHLKKNISKTTNFIKTYEEIKNQILEDLYSELTKKVKKNTLKIIFDLHLKIKDLEKKLKDFQIIKEKSVNKNKLDVKNEVIDSPIVSDSSIISLEKVLSKNKNFLKDEVVKSLKIQDSTIAIMNEKINNYKKAEEKFLLQIIDLEQDKTILSQKAEKYDNMKDHKVNITHTKKNFKFIYTQVEKQKKIFSNLKNYSIKIKQDSNLYKENYEKLVVENNNIKISLINAKDQIIVHENNKQDLLLSISQLNETLSKTNFVTNITPQKLSVKEDLVKKKKNFEIIE